MNDQFIQGVIFDWDKIDKDSYLKGIRAFKGVEKLDFNKPITFFVGENDENVAQNLAGPPLAVVCSEAIL